MLLTAGYFWEHALVFHNERGWVSPVPMVSWVQGHLLQPLHISPAMPAFEGCWPCQVKEQVPTFSLGTYPASSSAWQGPGQLEPSSSSACCPSPIWRGPVWVPASFLWDRVWEDDGCWPL